MSKHEIIDKILIICRDLPGLQLLRLLDCARALRKHKW